MVDILLLDKELLNVKRPNLMPAAFELDAEIKI
jgi:hypothetical protein